MEQFASFIASLCQMQLLQANLQLFTFNAHQVSAYVPDPVAVREYYKQNPADFPYWSQVWPAALGLCLFLEKHPDYIEDKTVLELGAGLALPSFLAARYSRTVHCSDHSPEAVGMQEKTIVHNNFTNVGCSILDWNDLPDTIIADVLLLSDVNYDPWVFDKVYLVIMRFLHEQSLVILSTPQRLMAKSFIERLLPFCFAQEEIVAHKDGKDIPVTIFLLQLKPLV